MSQPPQNGSCSTSPSNGTITTLFTISCLDWFDEDGIKDYSIYSDKTIIAFSSVSVFQIYLPSGENQNIVSQLLISLSQQLNQINQQNIDKAVSNGIPISTISISSLANQNHQPTIYCKSSRCC